MDYRYAINIADATRDAMAVAIMCSDVIPTAPRYCLNVTTIEPAQ